MKVCRQYAACYLILWGLSHFLQELLCRASEQGSQTSAPWEPHTLSLPAWKPQDPHHRPREPGETAAVELGYRQEATGLPGALPDSQWEGAGVGLQLCEAQNPCLGPSFFLLSRRKKFDSKGAYITAVGTGVILDVPRGAETEVLQTDSNGFYCRGRIC